MINLSTYSNKPKTAHEKHSRQLASRSSTLKAEKAEMDKLCKYGSENGHVLPLKLKISKKVIN